MKIRFVVFGTELSTGLSTLIIATCLVAIIAVYAAKCMSKEENFRITSTFTAVVDYMIEGVKGMVSGVVGDEMTDEFMPLGLSLFFVLLVANTLSLIGIQEAVTDLIVPFFLVICLFAAWTIFALKRIGLGGYLKGCMQPNILMAPLEILGRITTPLSMALRIFGNILSGYIIMTLIWMVIGAMFASGSFFLIIGALVMMVVSIGLIGYFSIFSPVIQALVFMSLALAQFKGLIEE